MPWYHQILLFAICCVILAAYVMGKYFPEAPTAPRAQAEVTNSSEGSHMLEVEQQVTEEKSAPTLAPISSVLMAYPENVTQVPALIIPAGYHLQSIDEFDKVTFVQKRLEDGSMEVQFTTVGTEPVQIMVTSEADEK